MSVTTAREDLRTRITHQIIEQLERGVRPWMRPWSAEHLAGHVSRPLRAGGQPYRGINVLLLWMAAEAKGYAAPIWMTYRQAAELGGQVRKGEKASPVTYADTITRQEVSNDGNEEEREIRSGGRWFLKQYSVFNVEQIDGLPAHFYGTAMPVLDPMERIARADAFFAATGMRWREGGSVAAYNVAADLVRMPPFASFRDPQSFYATLAHEACHWTRHPSRLNRDFGRKRFGDEGYAMEELVAEMGSAFIAADLGLSLEPREDHAAYLASWLRVLKDDKRALFVAAAHAQKAADFLAATQPQG
jgi:antirestriction protein ArdC